LHNFYSKNKVSFQYVIPNNANTHIIKIIWNELYIDKQKEILSLLPWVNIYNNNDYKPNLWSIKWLWVRIKNLYFLFKIKENKWKIENYLHHYFIEDINKYSFNELLNNFLHVYETIYEINYFTSKSFKKLQLALTKEKISFSELVSINIKVLDIDNLPKFNIDHSEFKWNSININDENTFVSQFREKNNSSAELYWKSLPIWKQNYLRPIIADAIYYEYMREIGRHLTVKYMSRLRVNINKISDESNIKTDINFANINEIISWKINEKLLQDRKYQYNRYDKYNFPTSITDSFIQERNDSTIWISSWITQWKLVNLESLKNIILDNKSNENTILFTNILSPELTKFFPYISWIISEIWGELSHLAIMAREHNIPIVTNFNIVNSEIKLWDSVEINGNNWEIIKNNK
jgi:phosphohistidine swiveling domain-containing protein